jgi:hypothetical protein
LVGAKIELKTLFGWGVEFTPIIVIVTTNLRALLVNFATPTHAKVFADSLKHQVPFAVIFIELDALVRNLPE